MDTCPFCGTYPRIEKEDGRHVHEVPIDKDSWKEVVGSIGDGNV